jgi:hypothetical protein
MIEEYPQKDSRDPGDIPKESRLNYSRDFRHEKALSQMGFLNVSMLVRNVIECLIHKPFWKYFQRNPMGSFNRLVTMDET